MKLVIAGATGFIGSILTDRLWNQFHDLTLLSRRPPAEVNVTKKQWFAWQPGFRGEWEKAVDGADGIINLAGEPIAGKRWSAAQKEILRSSRIDATKSLVNAIANIGSFIGPSLVGWIRDQTGNFSLGIVVMGIGPLLAAVIAASLRSARKFEQPAAFDASGGRS